MSFRPEHFIGCFTEKGVVHCYRLMKKSEISIAINAYSHYMHEKHKTLFDVYKAPSDAKRNIWAYWERACEKAVANSLSVIYNNSNFFTVGFIVTCDSRDYFVYITANKHYMLDITHAWEVTFNDHGTVRTDRFPYLNVSEKGVYNFASEAFNGIAYVSLALTRGEMVSLQRVPTIQV